jgi:hypothetical protein
MVRHRVPSTKPRNMSTYQTAFDHLKFITGQDNLRSSDGMRVLNFALDAYSSIAMDSQGRWKFADKSRDSLERSYTAAVAGQNHYPFDSSFDRIDGIQVEVNGVWKGLTPADRREHKETPPDELYSAPGTPLVYDLDGDGFSVYPAPSWSDSGDLTDIENLSIRVLVTRAAAHITSFSQEIGIPLLHLEYLALHGARQLGFRTVGKERTDVRDELVKWEGTEINGRMSGGKIRAFYSSRDEDRPRVLKPKGNRVFMRRNR